jgi:hypothetical protein
MLPPEKGCYRLIPLSQVVKQVLMVPGGSRLRAAHADLPPSYPLFATPEAGRSRLACVRLNKIPCGNNSCQLFLFGERKAPDML